jgi:hypothetical protein
MNETCQALSAPDGVEVCGDTAVDWVYVRTKVTSAKVPVCGKHKGAHNRGAAKLRTESRTPVK